MPIKPIYTSPIPTPPLGVDTRRTQVQAGVAALKAGRAAEARSLFERLLASGTAEPGLLVALALACRMLGDTERAIALVDTVLADDPDQIRALLLKGSVLAERGEKASALAFFDRALALAGDAVDAPPEIRNELQQARRFQDERKAALSHALDSALVRAGLTANDASSRFGESIDILFARRQRFVQTPRYYFFPGLACTAFFPRESFPFFAALENETAAIRDEVRALIAQPSTFEPYVKSNPLRPANRQAGMADNPAWGAFYLYKDGRAIDENLARCPKTAAAIARLPLCTMPNRSPSVLFSRLAPGARIPPHSGMVNTRLICHLPLIVPAGCGFRVGNQTREWVEGVAWAFDDSIEHEAWNYSEKERVILLFEVWRPDLSDTERRAICALFEALDAENGAPPAWEI
jgi:tetratricopeptide (TPR) repeat protein